MRQIPMVERETAYWTTVRGMIADLGAALDDLREGDEVTAIAATADLDVAAMDAIAVAALGALAGVRSRVSRRTINIGVSGRARNGKSTLLQSLSGLSDDQIPAGRGQPVTAVRSSIYHSTVRTGAVLTLHNEASFCAGVLAPYHRALNLMPTPRTLLEFSTFRYPPTADELTGDVGPHPKSGPMLARLREMQRALPSFRGYLTGHQREVTLTESELASLKDWVAYPAATTGPGVPDRRYLAVKDAAVTCRFPIDDVADLGLVDLPGLGELVPDADRHHLDGLKDDVDFVIVVKRPTDTNALWSVEDGDALQLIIDASGAAAVRDFVTILVNSGGCAAENIDALQRDIRDRLNEGLDDRSYNVITADSADREQVKEQVLQVVLEHLATALPRMDADVFAFAQAACETGREQLRGLIGRHLAALRSIHTPSELLRLDHKRTELLDEVTTHLHAWIEELQARTGAEYADQEFLDEVTKVQDRARSWVIDGFGVEGGQAAWVEQVLPKMLRAAGPATVMQNTLNGIRTEIAIRFNDIDSMLDKRRNEFWKGLAGGLGPRFANLLQGDSPEEVLRNLRDTLDSADHDSPSLVKALDQALDVRLDYRTRLLPEVWRKLEALMPYHRKETEEQFFSMLTLAATAEGGHQLFNQISGLARSVITDIGGMLSGEPSANALILLAYGQYFEDAFIRSAGTPDDFLNVTTGFQDQLWPEEVSGPATSTVRIQRAKDALNHLNQALTGSKRSNG
ncbi:hypothetical protein ABUW04_03580 [Streptacidiphilus sp. N1-10]|uniref:G domain-containing protein n=1 Tax=Streptacidiphilus jeojiensis TaxID=3229225 RepID=A0ABV6XGF2_9ACTN